MIWADLFDTWEILREHAIKEVKETGEKKPRVKVEELQEEKKTWVTYKKY